VGISGYLWVLDSLPILVRSWCTWCFCVCFSVSWELCGFGENLVTFVVFSAFVGLVGFGVFACFLKL